MDRLITDAARALAAGDPLGALNLVALRNDASALALRGIAMAQLGGLKQTIDDHEIGADAIVHEFGGVALRADDERQRRFTVSSSGD